MPAANKHKPYRKRKGRMRYVNKGLSVANTAMRAYKIARKAIDFINVEFKYHDATWNGQNVDWNGTFQVLNAIGQGDTATSRDGNQLKLQRLSVKGFLQGNGSYGINQVARVIIFWDKQNKISAVSDFLDSGYLASINAVNAHKDQPNKYQTYVLHDKCYTLQGGTYATHASRCIDVDITLSTAEGRKFHSSYDGSSTTPVTGALKMLVISNISNASSPPQINMVSRVYFNDN